MDTRNSTLELLIKLLVLLIAIAYSSNGSCQADSNKLITTGKIHVVLDRSNGVLDIDNISKDTFYQTEYLNSVGFKDVLFLAIRIKDIPNISIDKSNQTPFSCEYLIAYDAKNNYIYYLKGFRKNNFEKFYNEHFPNQYKSSKTGKFLDKSTLSNFKIDGIDLDCLYSLFILKNKSMKTCCISCVERDTRYAVFK